MMKIDGEIHNLPHYFSHGKSIHDQYTESVSNKNKFSHFRSEETDGKWENTHPICDNPGGKHKNRIRECLAIHENLCAHAKGGGKSKN